MDVVTRRWRIAFAIAVLASPILLAAAPGDYWMYVATNTSRGGNGIYAFKFHSKTGRLETGLLAGGRLWQANSDTFSGGFFRMVSQIRAEWPSLTGIVRGVQNPVYLAVRPDGRTLYTADDVPSSTVSAFRIDPANGKLTMLSSRPAGGNAPCFLSVDTRGRNLLTANVLGPNIVNFSIDADGSLDNASSVAWHKGSGADAHLEAHPHSVVLSPDNRFALAADMGLDEVLIYRFDVSKGGISPGARSFVKTPSGAGARILTFHPSGRFAYLIEELGSSISAMRWDAGAGALTVTQTVSTLPKDFHGANAAAEVQVHPNGRFLYASNRGHDSIAVFGIDQTTGELTPIDFVSSGGRPPRQILFDPTGAYLFAVNVETQIVVEFRVDPNTGQLTRTGQDVHLPYPMAIRFAPAF
jgi:6-phosphogluconolactonase